MSYPSYARREIKVSQWDKLTDFIDRSQNIILSTHKDPDGDGLGSEIAFYYYLKSSKK